MPTKRKPRVDSIQGQLAVYQAVSAHVEPPVRLNEAQKVIFDDIIASRAATSWSRLDLRHAAKLAQLEDWADKIFDDLSVQGASIIHPQKGTPIANPLQSAMMQTTASIQALTRTLGLSASQTGKTGDDAKAANEASDKAREALSKASNSFA